MKRDVILITDGDFCAQKAIETAVKNIGARCISRSAGNPTELTGRQIVDLVKDAKNDPVVVMVDDRGNTHKGPGEAAMEYIINSEDINILGVIAVASNTHNVKGVKVDCSIDRDGNLVKSGVDKLGFIKANKIVKGDTVDILSSIDVPILIGIGDPGKMDGLDNVEIGAPIVTKALEEILKVNNKIPNKI